MILRWIFLGMAILFLTGLAVALIRKRWFLAAEFLLISFIVGKLADAKILRNIFKGEPNYIIILIGGLLAVICLFCDQMFFGKRNYSYKDFLNFLKKRQIRISK